VPTIGLRMWTRLATFTIGFFFYTVLSAQLMSATISFDYNTTDLGTVIEDLSNRYQLRFTYSPTQLPLNFGITAKVENENLEVAIAKLFEQTPIKYAFIAEQIALRADRGLLAQLEIKKAEPRQNSPIYSEKKRETVAITQHIPSWKNTDPVQSKQSSTDQ